MLEQFIIGFEFEFGCSLTRRALSEKMKERGWVLKGNKPVKWTITDDWSIATSCPYEHEVISPPMPGPEAIVVLRQFLKLLRDIGAETNRTTGLHINISFSDKTLTSSIDLLKLLSSIPDTTLARYYNRQDNDTCAPVESFFKDHRRIYVDRIPKTREQEREAILNHFLKKASKYHTVNLKKWKFKKYIEYRFAGGCEYEFNYSRVKRDIMTVLKVMLKSCNGTISRSADKIVAGYDVKFLSKAKSSDSEIDFFDLYHFGLETNLNGRYCIYIE